MKTRPHEAPMPDPLAYFLTWATYGTWLPGDKRGWIEYRHGWQLPDPVRELEARARMVGSACRLDSQERRAVEQQVTETCGFRGWQLHVVNCRSNHVHVVVSAPVGPKSVRSQLKAWCTTALKNLNHQRWMCADGTARVTLRENWWAERGSQRFVNDDESLEAAIIYVRDGQDKPRP